VNRAWGKDGRRGLLKELSGKFKLRLLLKAERAQSW
jgi:hypothetical protein